MKYLHVIQANERNSYNLFLQMHERYDLSDHTFFVCNYRRVVSRAFPKFYEFKNFVYMEEKGTIKKLIKFYKLFKEADHIVLHSLIFTSKKYLLFLYLFRSFLKKATWIEWGADLYNWELPGLTLKEKFLNHINREIRKSVSQVGLTIEADEEEVHKQLGEDIKCIYTPLPFAGNRLELLEATRPKKEVDKGFVRVQVAHNALQLNNHINILSRLEKFKHENMQLVLPLSYGTFGINGRYGGTTYRKSVIKCAELFFTKEKTVVMSKEMPLDRYLRYLWSVDVAVFNVNRPIVLANIIYMLYMGKKVYLPENSPHYKFFVEKGLPIYKTEDIDRMTYEEFIYNPKQDHVPTWILNRLTPGEDIKNWDVLINGDFLDDHLVTV